MTRQESDALTGCATSPEGRRPSGFSVPVAVLWVTRLVLAVVLLRSGLAKFQNPYAFLIAVYRYEVVGPSASLAIAILLPAVEMALGVCLVAGVLLRGATLVTCLISLTFIAAIISVMVRGLEISCGCFGTSSEALVDQNTLWRAIALFLLAATSYLLLGYSESRTLRRADLERVSRN